MDRVELHDVEYGDCTVLVGQNRQILIDVYKRQVLESAVELEEPPLPQAARERVSAAAVSYTHLDVYKRQPASRCAASTMPCANTRSTAAHSIRCPF